MSILDHPLHWQPDLNTGIPAMDEQHRYLLHAINQAREDLLTAGRLERLDAITRDLLAYALFHFDTEETLMAEHAYALAHPEEAARHCHEHREFSQRVRAVREALQAEQAVDPAALLCYLEAWLFGHIRQTDHRLGEFLRENGLPGNVDRKEDPFPSARDCQ